MEKLYRKGENGRYYPVGFGRPPDIPGINEFATSNLVSLFLRKIAINKQIILIFVT